MQGTEIIYWRDIPTNRFQKKPNIYMLNPGGVILYYPLEGSKKGLPKVWHQIKYDEDYVYAKIIYEILFSLQPLTLEQWQEIAARSWEEFQKQRGETIEISPL